ncbi:MAG: glycogen/starch synthase [Porphyromonas sp.]|nr:glycogen/starch synthase [Porphyromonas sp.]
MIEIENSVQPTLVMETSWEVCNKVGGIYAVLSTRARTMVESLGDEGVLFVGPLFPEQSQPDFLADEESNEAERLSEESGLEVRVGRWQVPGNPRAILVDFKPLFEEKDRYYFEMWQDFGIEGDSGYGDYDDACLFSIAVARVMMAYLNLHPAERPVAQFNEWTCGMGLLYLHRHRPEVATTFITHATTTGRSIAGNGKDLYSYMAGYNGDQMAEELGVAAKHKIEKCAAHYADAFGTVSEVTDVECRQLLQKPVDVVVYNGFEQGFIPTPEVREKQRHAGRKRLLQMVRKLCGEPVPDNALIVMTSGRSEYRNKGLDLFIDAVRRLTTDEGRINRDVVALIAVPGWVAGPRPELQWALEHDAECTMPMQEPYLTHWLNEPDNNQIYSHLKSLDFVWGKGVYPLFLPEYLDGRDGILDIPYYDFIPAVDLTVFASYYEPWGYTPLESIAFGVPTLTTDKAGFGQWASGLVSNSSLKEGVHVLERRDDNFGEVATAITRALSDVAQWDVADKEEARANAERLAQQADWAHFYPRYQELFARALLKH